MKSRSRRRGLSIRSKILLASGLLLVIPYVGYQYVREMERYLREGLESSLTGAAQALAGALHERRSLFGRNLPQTVGTDGDLYAYTLNQPVQLDGYADDWSELLPQARTYGRAHVLLGTFRPGSLSFRNLVGTYGSHLYALFLVRDDHLVYREPGSTRPDRSDHLRIAMEDPGGVVRHFVLSTSSPGWVSAYENTRGPDDAMQWRPEPLIRGEWQETADGYTLEVRIPLGMLGRRLRFAIGDVDDKATRRVVTLIGTAGRRNAEELGMVVFPSPEIQDILRGLGRTPPGRRVRVLDAQGRVLAGGGSLARDTPGPGIGLLYSLLLGWPPENVQAGDDNAPRLQGKEIDAALAGTPASRWYATPEKDTVVVSAAYPVWGDGRVLGAVVVQETTQAIQTVQRRALAELFNKTLVVFVGGTLVLLLFATRLSIRLRRLRNEVEAAVDAHGRVTGRLAPSMAGDEIGDLSRGFGVMIERLRQYNHYLENLAGRLSHELRTPLAVVRSSLDNLDSGPEPEEVKLITARARDGLSRLGTIITRMSEATRLEQALQAAERVEIDAGELVSRCVSGYRVTWPQTRFEWYPPAQSLRLCGAPDLIAQMLDKLVANAVDFCVPERPVVARLERTRAGLRIEVQNNGPLLPETMQAKLFESMVSIRPKGPHGEPHLGLGLYVARLIAEFHGGAVSARNLHGGDGVCFTVELPAIA